MKEGDRVWMIHIDHKGKYEISREIVNTYFPITKVITLKDWGSTYKENYTVFKEKVDAECSIKRKVLLNAINESIKHFTIVELAEIKSYIKKK